MPKRVYENSRIRVFWDSSKCLHSENCAKSLPDVFNPDQRPWINVDAAAAEEIKRVIDRCPSSALSYEMLENPESETCICLIKNGPYRITGKLKLIAPDGTVLSTEECVVLCRCGHSSNMPFCDGTHVRAKFRDKG